MAAGGMSVAHRLGMATPLGHALVGAAVGALVAAPASVRRRAAVGVLAALAPDLDFIPGAVLGDPARFHHAESHSLAFALGVAGWAALAGGADRWHWALLAALAYGSHLAVDVLTYDDSPPHGIPLAWPVSAHLFESPVPLLPNVPHASAAVVSLEAMLRGLVELVLFVPLAVWAVIRARRREGVAR